VAQPLTVGSPSPGATVIPTGQLVHPAGRTVEIPARPVDLARSADGQFVFVKENSGVTVIDAATWAVKQRLSLGGAPASMTGMALSRDGAHLYVTDASSGVRDLAVKTDGTIAAARTISLPGPSGPKDSSYPCGIALTQDDSAALVCLSRNNTLAIVDLKDGSIRFSIDVGVAPFAVVVAPDEKFAFVSNWGGRRPMDGEPGANSSGTRTLIDPRGVASSGGVSIVDLETNAQIAYVETGLQASNLALSRDGQTLFVANSNADTVTQIDVAAREVSHQVVVKPDPSLPFGSMPSALALSANNETLYVTCAGNNAVAVISLSPGTDPSITGWIPTGWYPGAILANGPDLTIANIKGIGSRGAREDGSFNSHRHRGSIQRVPIPDAPTLAALTAQVKRDARVPQILRAMEAGEQRAAVKPVPVPAHPGEPSVIEHVLYIIKENRTYDQVFGDLAGGDKPRGNGKPALCIYGRDVTPNQHALAESFVLLDNYYCNGVLSADGHSWATEGNSTPYLERSFGGFTRSYTFGDDPLTYSSSGFIWDHILAAGYSFRNFGEMNYSDITPSPGKSKSWADVYEDWKSGTHAFKFPASIGIDNLRRYTDPDAPGWNMSIPDQVRADHFIKEFNRFDAEGSVPSLMILYLPNDHTSGVSEGTPTPRAYVADNDLAVGRVVEAISHSKIWSKTCIFVNEDDPQDGWDHVDGHRSTCLVISPHCKRDTVVSEFYNQAGVVHTIERIFGLAPANQIYGAAPLMTACFTDTPDAKPYSAIIPQVPIDEVTSAKPKRPAGPGDGNAPPSQKSSPAKNKQALAAERDLDLYAMTAAQDLSKPDLADEQTLNLVLWHAANGLGARYPAEYAGAHGAGLAELGLQLDMFADQDDDDDDR
jgi:DNA-binding beta-propeller fold protein YncE